MEKTAKIRSFVFYAPHQIRDYSGDQICDDNDIREDVMDGAYSSRGRDEKCV